MPDLLVAAAALGGRRPRRLCSTWTPRGHAKRAALELGPGFVMAIDENL